MNRKRQKITVTSITDPKEYAAQRTQQPQPGARPLNSSPLRDPAINAMSQDAFNRRQKFNQDREQRLAANGEMEYRGPEVALSHDAATKAAQAEARINQGANYPHDSTVIRDEDDPQYKTVEDLPDGFTRINPPSGCIFYDFDSIGIRPFTVPEIIKLTGCGQTMDIVGFHDIISRTITCDLRKLWWSDYIYLLFWHRLHSYVKIPYKISWTSIYGNQRSDEITRTHLGKTNLKITEEEWIKYKAQGFAPQTVGDAEKMAAYKFDPDSWKLWLRAQYLQGDTVADKLNAINNMDIDSLVALKHFVHALNDVGVQEFIKVCDVDLPRRWQDSLDYLQSQLIVYNEMLSDNNSLDSLETENLLKVMKRVANEFKRLSEINNQAEAEPLLETIKLNINELTFLPRI